MSGWRPPRVMGMASPMPSSCRVGEPAASPAGPVGRIDLGQPARVWGRCAYHGRLQFPESSSMSLLPSFLRRPSLVTQIVLGLLAGIALVLASPRAGAAVGLLGTVFVSALKAVAPVLVLVLVAASIAGHRQGRDTRMRPILGLYLVGTGLAALVGVAASFLFPTTLALAMPADTTLSAPGGIGEVLKTLVLRVFDNPVSALANANYIGLLAWGIALGIALRRWGCSASWPPSWPTAEWPRCSTMRTCWRCCWARCCSWPWWAIRRSCSR